MSVPIYKVYGISDCPACLRVCADLMEEYPKAQYVFINCDFSKEYQAAIKRELKWPTFPIVVLTEDNKEALIGGSEALRDLMR